MDSQSQPAEEKRRSEAAQETSSPAAESQIPLSDEVHRIIEMRAYEIWQEENCPQGKDIENWVRAERETLANTRLLKDVLNRS